MTTAPRPQTEVETGPEPAEAEGWALLDGLRRRLDDQGAQTRKTAAQVTQLADSIAALVEAQRKRTRGLNLNSFVAYVIFTVLCGGAFYLLYQHRAGDLVSARDRATTELLAATKRADEATAKLAARDAADAKAWDAWQLLEAGKRDDASKRLTELAHAPLSRLDRDVLAARAKQAEMMQVDAAFKAAQSAFRAGRFGEVVVTLEGALNLHGAAPRAAEMHYLIGLAHLKTNELDKAVTHLQAAVAADVGEEDARFQLAGALDRAGLWAKARVEYDRFSTAHPQSPSAVFAMRRSATLARMPAQAPWVTAAQQQAGKPAEARPEDVALPPVAPAQATPKPTLPATTPGTAPKTSPAPATIVPPATTPAPATTTPATATIPPAKAVAPKPAATPTPTPKPVTPPKATAPATTPAAPAEASP